MSHHFDRRLMERATAAVSVLRESAADPYDVLAAVVWPTASYRERDRELRDERDREREQEEARA